MSRFPPLIALDLAPGKPAAADVSPSATSHVPPLDGAIIGECGEDDSEAELIAAAHSASAGDADRTRLATAFMKFALKGRRVQFKTDVTSMYWMDVYYNRWYRNLITLVAMLHMSLALVEPSSNMNGYHTAPPEHWVIETRPVEAVILLCYIVDISLKMRFMGAWEYFRSWNKAEFLCTACFAVDLVVPGGTVGGLQFSRILRPVFIVTKRKHIRFIFTGILHSIPRMVPVLMLLAFGVIAFAIAATMALATNIGAFEGIPNNTTLTPPYCSAYSRGECGDYFQDFSLSFYHLFVLVARANWPLAMLPYYQRSEWSGLFFAGFLLVGHFFLWRLLLAVSFASFADHCRDQYVAQQQKCRASLKAAFALMSYRGFMDSVTFRRLAAGVRSTLPIPVVDTIFHAVGGHLGFIDAQGFVAACTLLDVKAQKIHFADGNTAFKALRLRIERVVTNHFYGFLMDASIMLVALVELLLQNSQTSHEDLSVQSAVSIFIFVVFLAEVACRLFALGPSRYWRDGFNRIDVFVILMTFASFISTQTYGDAGTTTRVRIMLFLRLARILRLANRIHAVENVLLTVVRITPLLWRIVIILIITMYVLAVIGVEAFSGLLDRNDPLVQASAYGVNEQYSLNYDTFTKSFMAQFAVLITTQSPVILEGLMAGTRSWWPALYFASAYIIIVCVVSNILIALLLQSYGTSSSHIRYRQEGSVEIWEHLLARAQLDLHKIDPVLHPHPICWVFRRRNAFLTVNESLFGEALALPFEIDNEEREERLRTHHGGGGGASNKPPRSARTACRSCIRSTTGCSGAAQQHNGAGEGDDWDEGEEGESSAAEGISSMRVHSTFDAAVFASDARASNTGVLLAMSPVARAGTTTGFQAIESSLSPTAAQRSASGRRLVTPLAAAAAAAAAEWKEGSSGGAGGVSSRASFPIVNRSLTEFIRSFVVLSTRELEGLARGTFHLTNKRFTWHPAATAARDSTVAPTTEGTAHIDRRNAFQHPSMAGEVSPPHSTLHAKGALGGTSSTAIAGVAESNGSTPSAARTHAMRRIAALAVEMANEHAALRALERAAADSHVRRRRQASGGGGGRMTAGSLDSIPSVDGAGSVRSDDGGLGLHFRTHTHAHTPLGASGLATAHAAAPAHRSTSSLSHFASVSAGTLVSASSGLVRTMSSALLRLVSHRGDVHGEADGHHPHISSPTNSATGGGGGGASGGGAQPLLWRNVSGTPQHRREHSYMSLGGEHNHQPQRRRSAELAATEMLRVGSSDNLLRHVVTRGRSGTLLGDHVNLGPTPDGLGLGAGYRDASIVVREDGFVYTL